MPNTNQFLPFGTAAVGGFGPYVYSPAVWATKNERITGYPPGLLPKEDLNTALRQACFVSAALSQWVADYGPAGANVNDDGVIANWETQFQNALSLGGLGATFKVYAGNPNGNLAGTQGNAAVTPTVFPSVCWDTTNTIWWVCSVTGNAATAVWLPIGDDVGWPNWSTQSGGTANAPTLAPPPTLRNVVQGTAIGWKATTGPNTGAVVVTITGFGAFPLLKAGPTGPEPLIGKEIQVGDMYVARADGAGNLQLVATELGTAALANASSQTGTVAAVQGSGAVSAGHIAVFTDNLGTVGDGGAPGTLVTQYIDTTNNGNTLGAGVYLVNSSAGAFAVNLPLLPAKGTCLEFRDVSGTWSPNNFTLNRNGQTIMGAADNLVCNVQGEDFGIWFNGTDWRLF